MAQAPKPAQGQVPDPGHQERAEDEDEEAAGEHQHAAHDSAGLVDPTARS